MVLIKVYTPHCNNPTRRTNKGCCNISVNVIRSYSKFYIKLIFNYFISFKKFFDNSL